MNIGATEQEIQESKKQDLTRRERRYSNRRYPDRREKEETIYFYNADGIRPNRDLYPEDIYVPIENYSANLIRQLNFYLNNINRIRLLEHFLPSFS